MMDEFQEGNARDLEASPQMQTGTTPAVTYQPPPSMSVQEAMEQQPWTRPHPGEPMGIFSPGSPVLPILAEDYPRIFEYRIGYNLVYTPRAGYGLASFAQLRNLAATCQEIRLNIELIKREIRSLEWSIVPVGEEGHKDTTGIEEVEDFWERPDQYHTFDVWLTQALEEVLTIDALALFPRLRRDGQLYSLDIIAGDTLKPLLDFRGRTPLPPVPAYTQVLWGYPRWYGNREELLYRPFNSVAYNPYGTSPIEYVILAVNLALRRTILQVNYLSEGNIPEALVGIPSEWSVNQMKDWQDYWDAQIAGKLPQQARLKFIPVDRSGGLRVYEMKKASIDATARDEWLMKLACWAYGNNPAEFGLVSGGGLGGKGYTESMEAVQYRSIITPLCVFMARLFTDIIHKRQGYPNLQFKFTGLEPKRDQVAQAGLDQIYVPMGVYNVEYIQEREAIPPRFRPAPEDGAAQGGNPEPAPADGKQAQIFTPPTAASEVAMGKRFFRRAEHESAWESYG